MPTPKRSCRGCGRIPLDGNFILCEVRGLRAKDVRDRLREQGIMIRYFDSPGLRNCIRISVGKPDDTDRLIDALKDDGSRRWEVSAPREVERRDAQETSISLELDLDGTGRYEVTTGIGMFDHMLEQLARHGLFDLRLDATGDIERDPHHLVEDVGLVLGQAFDRALGERRGISRFGHAIVPMDEALALVAIDLGGRPHAAIDVIVRSRAHRPAPGRERQALPRSVRAGSTDEPARAPLCRRERPPPGGGDLQGARAGAAGGGGVDERVGGEVPSTKEVL